MLDTDRDRPFFSIGVPTYNRHELLRETLQSVLDQGFNDFEIIVGNDYTAELLTLEMLGISDPRIRIVNHPRNLREVGNMNAVLGEARGRYFSWLFDDDLYEPGFLQTAHDCLVRAGLPPAFFSSFRMMRVGEPFEPREIVPGAPVELNGREFLQRYSASRPEIGSTCGFFDVALLRSVVGGVEELCASAIGIYCEYLFLVKCALLGRILFVDAPYYVYRRHAESWSESNVEMDTHLAAGRELIRRCSAALRDPALAPDFNANLLKICQIHIITFAYKSTRFEFGHGKAGALIRALRGHRQESRATRDLFAAYGGDLGMRARFDFLKVDLFSYYLIARLYANFCYLSLRAER